MPLITFVEPDGTRREVSAHPGESAPGCGLQGWPAAPFDAICSVPAGSRK